MKNYYNNIQPVDPKVYKQSNRRAFVTKDDKNHVFEDFSTSGREKRIIGYNNIVFGDILYEYDKSRKTVAVSIFQSDVRTCFKLDDYDNKLFTYERRMSFTNYSNDFMNLLEKLMLATLSYQLNKILTK